LQVELPTEIFFRKELSKKFSVVEGQTEALKIVP
jgi:hypothetical protein